MTEKLDYYCGYYYDQLMILCVLYYVLIWAIVIVGTKPMGGDSYLPPLFTLRCTCAFTPHRYVTILHVCHVATSTHHLPHTATLPHIYLHTHCCTFIVMTDLDGLFSDSIAIIEV